MAGIIEELARLLKELRFSATDDYIIEPVAAIVVDLELREEE